MVLHRFAACVALASLLAGQSQIVLPDSHAVVEGTTSTNVPFGRSTPVRVQYAYDAALFPGPAAITALALRLDGGAGANPKTVDVEIRMSTLPVPLVGFGVDFAGNRGSDESVVLPRQLLSLPGQAPGPTPNVFQAPIPLAVPFSYGPQAGGLVIEIVVHGQPPGSYPLDATYVCDSPMVAVGPASCPGSSGLPLRAESATTQVIWGRPWLARVLDAGAGALALLALGTTESGPWAGLPLPLDLQALGAPSCVLSIDPAVLLAAVAAGNGSAVFPLAIPNNPQLLGEWLRFQGAAFDPGANALGLVTSQAAKVQVCGWEPVARLWAGDLGAAFGVREIGVGAVLRLSLQ